jgi:hypothetical protein
MRLWRLETYNSLGRGWAEGSPNQVLLESFVKARAALFCGTNSIGETLAKAFPRATDAPSGGGSSSSVSAASKSALSLE